MSRFGLAAGFCLPAGMLLLAFAVLPGSAQDTGKRAPSRASSRAVSSDSELARLRADVIEKMKESRASAEKVLAIHEQQSASLKQVYEDRRELYRQGLISRAELAQTERQLAEAIVRVDEDKKWLAESDIAVTEASAVDLAPLAAGGYSESGGFIRFNGHTPWSLADAGKIERFFQNSFGHVLPVSAFGQTPTHDRLRFDHRNAMDVALHPDSKEGRSLVAYLRQAGIPFLAFRGAVAGAATGAHIHIGNPSLRTITTAGSHPECCKR
jgi:hypothetical protein